MEQRRRQWSNQLRIEIKRLEKSQERDENTLQGLPAQSDYQKGIQKKIEERAVEIQDLIAKEKNVHAGLLDKELMDTINKESKAVQDRTRTTMQRKKEESDLKKKKKEAMYARWAKDKKRRNNQHQKKKKKNTDHSYERFCKANNSLPNYIKRNLADMPNNKGYIWKGVWYLGLQEIESSTQVMFEKCRDGILKIHEYSDTEYKLYEKKGKDRKVLVQQLKRHKRKNAPDRWV
jgi:hypothetical protein